MTEIQKAKREVSMRFWKQAIADCRTANIGVTAYCEKHGLNVHAYYYWLRQIRKELLDAEAGNAEDDAKEPEQAVAAPAATEPAAKPAEIVPVSAILDEPAAGTGSQNALQMPLVTIRCAGAAIDVRAGTPPDFLQMVVSIVKGEASPCSSAS